MSQTIPQDTPLKQCSMCKKFFPATTQFFHAHTASKGGLRSECKVCRSKRRKQHRKDNPEYYQEYAEEHRENHRQALRKYNATHKEKRNQYYQLNKDSEKQKQIARDISKRYRKNHPGYSTIQKRLRRCRKKGISGTYTLKDIQKQHERQKGKCYYCRHKVKWGEHHVDHVVPLSRGGTNDPSNLVITCPTCNLRKHDKLPHEWHEGGRLL